MFIYCEWASAFLFEILMQDLFCFLQNIEWGFGRSVGVFRCGRQLRNRVFGWGDGGRRSGSPGPSRGRCRQPDAPRGPWEQPRGFAQQVWSLTQSFSVCFLLMKQSFMGLEYKSMTPHEGALCSFRSLQQLPCLGPRPLNGLLSWHGSFPKALYLAPCVASGTWEIQWHREACNAWCRDPRAL